MQANEDLLNPSLDQGPIQLYSSRAGFIVAFFGGVVASVVFTLLNSRRLRRFNKDAWILAVCGLAAIAVRILLFEIPDGDLSFTELFVELGKQRKADPLIRYAPRMTALGVWMVGYFMHAREYRAMKLSQLSPLNPWKTGIIVTLTAGIVEAVILVGIIYLRV